MSVLIKDNTTISEPEDISKYDENEYVFALCRCPKPLTMGIPIKRVMGQSNYKFRCPKCNTAGTLICRGGNNDYLY